jgi:hypothetical protein
LQIIEEPPGSTFDYTLYENGDGGFMKIEAESIILRVSTSYFYKNAACNGSVFHL